MPPFPDSLSPPVAPGDVVAGKYLVERVLGAGGMGVVVAARHRLLGARVALKFVLPELAASPHVVQRFIKEAQAATRITGEHVARVTDVGLLDSGVPYMVMEYLEGDDLESVLDARGPLPLSEAVDYLLQGLQAVAEAHAKRIVHRDLKPSNFFLTRRADGTPLVKVLDFGIAKAVASDTLGGKANHTLTATRGALGSPIYMSPEQIRDSTAVDARTDVWSLGVVLHQLLTCKTPFGGESVNSLLAAILENAPVPIRSLRPELPESIERTLLGCFEKNVALRIPSVAALAERLAPSGSADALLSLTRIRGISGATPVRESRPTSGNSSPPAGAPALLTAYITPAITPSNVPSSQSISNVRLEVRAASNAQGTSNAARKRRPARTAALALGALLVAIGTSIALLGPRSTPDAADAPSVASSLPVNSADRIDAKRADTPSVTPADAALTSLEQRAPNAPRPSASSTLPRTELSTKAAPARAASTALTPQRSNPAPAKASAGKLTTKPKRSRLEDLFEQR